MPNLWVYLVEHKFLGFSVCNPFCSSTPKEKQRENHCDCFNCWLDDSSKTEFLQCEKKSAHFLFKTLYLFQMNSNSAMAWYQACKAALISFYETLRVEFGSDIGITIVTPGLIKTDMVQSQAYRSEVKLGLLVLFSSFFLIS